MTSRTNAGYSGSGLATDRNPRASGSGPGADRAALPFRQLGQAGDVAHDEFFADSPAERGAEHGSHDLDLANGVALLQPLVQELLDDRHGQARHADLATEQWAVAKHPGDQIDRSDGS
jgi:hypothetical protein